MGGGVYLEMLMQLKYGRVIRVAVDKRGFRYDRERGVL